MRFLSAFYQTVASILTTKGDIMSFSTTEARLAVGNNNEVLTADSNETLGVKWATTAASILTTKGDLATYSTVRVRLGVGTDNYLLTPDAAATEGLKYVVNLTAIQVAISDETTDLTTGTAKIKFRMPFAMTLLAGIEGVRGSLSTVATGTALLTIDINESGTTILSTKLTFDASESTSYTAATPVVISDTALADDAEITIDIDTIGDTTAGKGLKITLIGYPTII